MPPPPQSEYQSIIDDVLKEARKSAGSSASANAVAAAAFQSLAVAFGRKILAIIPGRVSTGVDARPSYDTGRVHRPGPRDHRPLR